MPSVPCWVTTSAFKLIITTNVYPAHLFVQACELFLLILYIGIKTHENSVSLKSPTTVTLISVDKGFTVKACRCKMTAPLDGHKPIDCNPTTVLYCTLQPYTCTILHPATLHLYYTAPCTPKPVLYCTPWKHMPCLYVTARLAKIYVSVKWCLNGLRFRSMQYIVLLGIISNYTCSLS